VKKRPRGRAPLPEGERKGRLIQARVDEELDETLRREAEKQRTTVSQLIRNVLSDTFRLVDNIVAETATLTEKVARDAKRIARSAKGVPRVDAWQEVVMNRQAVCSQCGVQIETGESAYMGASQDAGPRLWLCRSCGRKI
jgi:hypothetical protein